VLAGEMYGAAAIKKSVIVSNADANAPAHVHPSEPIVAKNMDISSVHLRPLTNELGGRRVRRPTVLLPPCFMTLHEQGFDSLPILAEVQCAITCPPRDIDCSVQVGMGLQTTDHTTKRVCAHLFPSSLTLFFYTS